jgi:hypothetical protein
MLNGYDRSVLGFGRDRFFVTPEAGTRDPWSYRLHEGIAYSGPGGSRLSDKPLVLNIDLNQWVRFERPGHCTVHALSHATGPQRQDVEVESNQIGIDIVAADPQWQEQELATDLAILNSTLSKIDSASFESRMNAARRLTYLERAPVPNPRTESIASVGPRADPLNATVHPPVLPKQSCLRNERGESPTAALPRACLSRSRVPACAPRDSYTARRTSVLRWMQDLISTKSTGTKISSWAACASHLPEALIYRTPSIFTEVFPEPACTSSGSRPKRAETSMRAWTSEWLVPGTVPAPACARIRAPVAMACAGQTGRLSPRRTCGNDGTRLRPRSGF